MVYAKLPFIPPSVNHAYFHKGKMRILTSKGKKFKAEVKTYLAKNCQEFLAFFEPNVPYSLLLNFNVAKDDLYFKTWPESAKTRYKTWDASNLIKLMEDAICAACAHDDKQHMIVVASKQVKKQGDPPNTEVWAFNIEREACPVDDWIGRQPR
jgi:Holliday junction resolvase RusA-like endonuclease